MIFLIIAAAGAVNLTTIITAVVALATGAGAALGLVGKRQRDLAELYKGLYEGKSFAERELREELARVSARLTLFESDFTRKIAEGVTEAILKSVTNALPTLLDEAHARDHQGDARRAHDRQDRDHA